MSMACRGGIPLIPRTCGLCQARGWPVHRRMGAALPTRIRGAWVCDGASTSDGCEGDGFCRYSGTKAGSVVVPHHQGHRGHPRATSGSSAQPLGHHQSPQEPARVHQSSRPPHPRRHPTSWPGRFSQSWAISYTVPSSPRPILHLLQPGICRSGASGASAQPPSASILIQSLPARPGLLQT